MYSQLYNFLSANDILYSFQSGFRENHSTCFALIDVIDNVYQHLDNHDIVLGLYLDLQEAFDTVDYDILLSKLYNYGIRGIVYNRFKDYLTGRSQYGSVSGAESVNLMYVK